MSSRLGNAKEDKVRDLMAAQGWFAMCSRGSHGCADVLAVKDGEPPRLIQVKGTKASPFSGFPPHERSELLQAAFVAGGVALLAWWPPYAREPKWFASHLWPIPRTASCAREARDPGSSNVKSKSNGNDPSPSVGGVTPNLSTARSVLREGKNWSIR